ncbi:MAG: CapA family protein, partial [Proteobacteria bacterium]
VDAVILTPHWGEAEYTQRVEPSQRALGRRFLEAGALAIFGNHPHVTKPWEKYVTKDGRETFVAYSIGNFVSGQASLAKKTSAIVYLGLTKVPGEKAFINGVSYIPLYMLSSPWEVVAVDRSSRAPKEANTLLAKLFDDSRRLDSRERIETNLECR